MTTGMLPVAILAGGLATRLLPVTQSIPKALLDVAGAPFVVHQIRLLRAAGVDRVVLCVGHLGELIESELEPHVRSLGMSIQFSFDGPRLLGTAGALRKAAPLLGDAFFVLYGDSYLRCDYAAVQRAFLRSGQQGLMTVYENRGRWDASNVEYVDGRIAAYDKASSTPRMRYIDYGLGALTSRTLDLVPAHEPSDLARLYQRLVSQGQLAGFEVSERFYEIGSIEGLTELRALLASPSDRATQVA
jgi:N-acetyl-alpha-D-muramate 1-phosphate uridylyltransferase